MSSVSVSLLTLKGVLCLPFTTTTRELYPVLMRALQAVPKELSSPPPRPLALQRIASLLTLLTQLTLAAGRIAPEPNR